MRIKLHNRIESVTRFYGFPPVPPSLRENIIHILTSSSEEDKQTRAYLKQQLTKRIRLYLKAMRALTSGKTLNEKRETLQSIATSQNSTFRGVNTPENKTSENEDMSSSPQQTEFSFNQRILTDQELLMERTWLQIMNNLDAYLHEEERRIILQEAKLQEHADYSEARRLLESMDHSIAADEEGLVSETVSDAVSLPTLRRQQLEVLRGVTSKVEKGQMSGYVEAPTGMGKTVMFIKMIEAALFRSENTRALIVVPTQDLVEQTKERMEQFAADMEIGLRYTHGNDLDKQVTITTYASLVSGVGNHDISPQEYSLVIFDEAHRGLSDLRADVIKQFEHSLRVGFTATPEYSDEKKVSHILGEVFHRTTIRDAIENGNISPYKNYIARIESTDMTHAKKNENGDYTEKSMNNIFNTQEVNEQIVQLYKEICLQEYEENQKTCIVNCASAKHARDLSEVYNQQGISAAALTGDMEKSQREDLLDKCNSGEIMVLCGYNLTVEGLDVPRVEVVVNMPTASRVRAIQRGGRALRRHKGKEYAVIVDVIPENYNPNAPPIIFGQVAGGAECFPSSQTPHQQEDGEGEGEETARVKDKSTQQEKSHLITDLEKVTDIMSKLEEMRKEEQREKNTRVETQMESTQETYGRFTGVEALTEKQLLYYFRIGDNIFVNHQEQKAQTQEVKALIKRQKARYDKKNKTYQQENKIVPEFVREAILIELVQFLESFLPDMPSNEDKKELRKVVKEIYQSYKANNDLISFYDQARALFAARASLPDKFLNKKLRYYDGKRISLYHLCKNHNLMKSLRNNKKK